MMVTASQIELDFAIPFIKIPTGTPRNGGVANPTLNVNANGLVTVGAMMFLFVTVVPKIVQLFVPQAQGNESIRIFISGVRFLLGNP